VRYGDAFSRTPFAKALDCPLSLPPGQSMLASHRPEKLRASGLLIYINVNTVASTHLALGQYVLTDVQ
jgi:hypothetical protein